MFTNNIKVVLSSQAYLSMISETYTFRHIETGGIYLGVIRDNIWYVLEIIDPGYQKTQRTHAYFEYDVEYVNHLANVRKRLYGKDLKLLGLWHRHPGSFDRFSSTDNETNTRFAQLLPKGAISALVNLDPDFRITMYHVTLPLNYSRIKNVVIGDSHIPSHIKIMRSPDDFTNFRPPRMIEVKQPANKGWNPIDSVKNVINAGIETLFTSNSEFAEDVPSQATNLQEKLMSMLDSELSDYLEKQTDYTYDMKMHADRIELNLKYVGTMSFYPEKIQCKFFIENEHQIVLLNNRRRRYEPGILKKFINEYVDQEAQRQPEEKESPTTREQTPEEKQYAAILGLTELYTKEAIHAAYIAKMKDYHPDTWHSEQDAALSEAATQKTQQVQDAYNFFKKRYNL